ncbi:hypothetical protein BOTBODRAFT_26752 [Botryobasidium botryosum FD-172 SS1]|uniref:Uncharacterized protein n=1 Tax=Botryobasidium botryosum (strain FD-172 SS1) TaxID=930990 RepID=A0A067NAC7_BOTB1|nr:hypothetical protein BOTBODRAFT_26752 [Botryobasidium botryosum FD-172 SS1]
MPGVITLPSPPTVDGPHSFSKKNKQHRGRKPILTWFQRKLAGKRDGHPKSEFAGASHRPKVSYDGNVQYQPAPAFNTFTLDSEPGSPHRSLSLSLAPGSIWSRSMQREADEDASIRPLPPTSPPSPAPSILTSHSSSHTSGYASELRTARSMVASTKPTTLLSIDLAAPMAHIAQAGPPSVHGMRISTSSPTSSPQVARFPSSRTANSLYHHQHAPSTSTATSITFSALPPTPGPATTNTTIVPPIREPAPTTVVSFTSYDNKITAPRHSFFHPRNNPRPSSPPPDNASTLTLASSNFAVSLSRPRTMELESVRGSTRWTYGSGGLSLRGFGSTGRIDGTDPDASVRAIRPMSRRGSWGSEDSGWSAALGSGGASIVGSRRDARGAPSFRTGRTGGLGDIYGDVEGLSEVRPDDDDDNGEEEDEEEEAEEDEELDDNNDSSETEIENDDESGAVGAIRARPGRLSVTVLEADDRDDTPAADHTTPSVVPSLVLEPYQIALPESRSRSVSPI